MNPYHEFDKGTLVDNITHFARALRTSGLPIGTGQTVKAIKAVETVGLQTRDDFFSALQCSLVNRPDQMVVFTQTFELFWRDPRYHDHMMSMMLPGIRGANEKRNPEAGMKRAGQSLMGESKNQINYPDSNQEAGEELEVISTGTTSYQDRFNSMDFEQMSTEETKEAKRIISELELPMKQLVSRRYKPNPKGRVSDWKSTMKMASRTGGETFKLGYQNPTIRYPNLVALCDISGSMSTYSRMLLHFLHSVTNYRKNQWSKVHSFTFGTKLTNITRNLAIKDVDQALESAGREVSDWEGGTRIGECLKEFNFKWSRRVLGQGALVLLITDGLESGDITQLKQEMKRLQLSARRLIWVNPLLRWDKFTPKARGISTMLPWVDCFKSAHNINSLIGLSKVLHNSYDDGDKTRLMQTLH
ncbi:MAG: VWA domain-containing protein [Paracoccaceae bacterium]|nr:VWA domain-containing protein [Paracoccaceae bacterium]MDE2917380.1 VWA domain-containing protein [Paracoccaceae bacterium]